MVTRQLRSLAAAVVTALVRELGSGDAGVKGKSPGGRGSGDTMRLNGAMMASRSGHVGSLPDAVENFALRYRAGLIALASRPQSSSASRFTAGAAGFFILSQSGERPER
jgi:hypothetical protein